MLQIGNTPAGLIGINELFERLFVAKIFPDNPESEEMLLDGVREHNYIPKPAIADYVRAITHAYQEFYAQKTGDENYRQKSYGKWRGYPHEHIFWFPTIADELCDGYGRCIKFCTYGVFQQQSEGKVQVVEPLLCKVGCSSCAAVCNPKAILFPPHWMLRDFRPIG